MSIRVLLAEDHAIVREGLRLLLDSQPDLEVVGGAADGHQALDLVRTLAPDVVLMDVAMPRLNGIEATRRIRDQHPATRTIILSMHATAEHVHRALNAGAHGYLVKEAVTKEVAWAVRWVCSGRRYLSEKLDASILRRLLEARRAAGRKSPLESLSRREMEVLQGVVEGESSASIAERLRLSPKTIETYRSRVMGKLSVDHVPGLVKLAIQHGVTTFD